MKANHILKEGDTVVLKMDGNKQPFHTAEGVFEVNVQVVDAMENHLYRVKPISGFGCRVVNISQLFY
jgi:hypothetical protein